MEKSEWYSLSEIEKASKFDSLMKNMQHKEINDFLESIGGCGSCKWWVKTDPTIPGCTLPIRESRKRMPVFDGGCICHSKL